MMIVDGGTGPISDRSRDWLSQAEPAGRCAKCETQLWRRPGMLGYWDVESSTECSGVPGGEIGPYIKARHGAGHPTTLHSPKPSR